MEKSKLVNVKNVEICKKIVSDINKEYWNSEDLIKIESYIGIENPNCFSQKDIYQILTLKYELSEEKIIEILLDVIFAYSENYQIELYKDNLKVFIRRLVEKEDKTRNYYKGFKSEKEKYNFLIEIDKLTLANYAEERKVRSKIVASMVRFLSNKYVKSIRKLMENDFKRENFRIFGLYNNLITMNINIENKNKIIKKISEVYNLSVENLKLILDEINEIYVDEYIEYFNLRLFGDYKS